VKKLSALLLFFALLAIPQLKAQLYFCGNYTDEGEPLKVSDTFTLGENGGYVYILFSNKKKVIHAKTLNVVVTKLKDKVYLPYDKQVMQVQDKKSWAIIDYHFTDGGNFKVSVEENNGRELSKNFLTVTLRNPNESQSQDMSPDEKYYSATILFCKSVKDGVPKETGHSFNRGNVYLFLKNDNKLATDSIKVKYYRIPPGGNAYEPYDVKRYGISGTYYETYFDMEFMDAGEYKVEIYNSRLAKMATGHVTITAATPDDSYYKSKVTFYSSLVDGNFVGESKSFPSGNVYVYLANESIFSTDSISVMVYKRKPGSQTYDQYYDFRKYGVNAKGKATYFSWDFSDSGDYSVEIYNSNFFKMGTGYLTITSSGMDPDKSYYNANTVFCEKIVNGFEDKPGTKFRTGQLYVVVRNDKALATDSIIVDVHKKGYETEQFNIFMFSQIYGIPSRTSATYFPLEFKESGQFKVEIYNRRQQKISEGIVTIR
jgi:hypothetical protein